MDLRPGFSHLIDGAYEAALDPGRWSDWVWRAAELFGGVCGGLHVVDRSGRIEHQTIRHKNMAAVDRYIADGIRHIDPQPPYAARLQSPGVYADTDHLDPEDPSTAEYLAWASGTGDLRHYISAVMPLPGGGRLAGLSIHRGAKDGPTSPADRRLMRALLPHLARAVALGFAHADKLTDIYWSGLLHDRREPCALLGPDGRVLRMTDAMERLLAAGDGLGLRGGRLITGEADGGSFSAMMLAGKNGGFPNEGSCRLSRPSGRRSLVVNLIPLPNSGNFSVPLEAAALIIVIDPDQQPYASSERWCRAFDFSPREAELAALLIGGHSIESAAEQLAISVATARVHLRHLFAKAEVSRQSELIRLLLRCG